MLTHIVLFKLHDRSPENVEATRARIAAIGGKIPQLLSIEVGANVVDSAHVYDIGLLTTFDSVEAMQAYQVHPVHVELLADVVPRFAEIASVDYQS
jgi:hypothetical protein